MQIRKYHGFYVLMIFDINEFSVTNTYRVLKGLKAERRSYGLNWFNSDLRELSNSQHCYNKCFLVLLNANHGGWIFVI